MPQISNSPLLVAIDLDGVLIDTATISLSVCVRVLTELGHDLNALRSNLKMIGLPSAEILRRAEKLIGKKIDCGTRSAILEEIAQREKVPKVFDGALDWVSEIECDIAIVSNAERNTALEKLRHVGISDNLDIAVFTRSDVRNPKPAPDMYIAAANHFDVSPALAVAIEDSVVGVKAAKAAGFEVIGLIHDPELRSHLAPDLKDAGASFVASTFDELSFLRRTKTR